MHFVIAPDKFKGVWTASQAAALIAACLPAGRHTCDICPMADGGEGTLDVLLEASRGQRRRAGCRGPMGDAGEAELGLSDDASTVVIESAKAIGLDRVHASRRDPLRASSFGLGELLAAALSIEPRRVIVALGGSATVDGGAGAAQALGAALYDAAGAVMAPATPRELPGVMRCDPSRLSELAGETQIDVAVDVLNPLLGPQGAARVFGPQKGADAAGVEQLEAALTHWAGVLERTCGRVLRDEPGSGAAGGAALPLLAFTNSAITPGVDLVMSAVRLHERVAAADLVITGEGRLDGQSLMGKVTGAVARLCRACDVPCVAVVGSVGDGHEQAEAEFNRVIVLGLTGEAVAETTAAAPDRLREALTTLC